MLIKLNYRRQSRRIRVAQETDLDLDSLKQLISEAFSFDSLDFGLTYIDDENDRITILDEQDLQESFQVFEEMNMVPKYYINHQESTDIPPNGEEYTDLLKTLYIFFKNSDIDIGQFLNDCRDITRQPAKTTAAQEVIQQFVRQVNTLSRKHSLPNPNHPTPFDGAIRRLLTRANTLQVPHEGVVCDGCQADPLVGVRYKCNHCPNFDYCQLCFDCLPHNSEHTFRAIVVPKSRNFLKEVIAMAKDRLTRIRTQSVEQVGSELEVIHSIQQPMFTMDTLSLEDQTEGQQSIENSISQEPQPEVLILSESNTSQSPGIAENVTCSDESVPTVYTESHPRESVVATWILCNSCQMPLRELVVTCTEHPDGTNAPCIQTSTTPLLPHHGEQYTLSIFMTAPDAQGCHNYKFTCEYEDGSSQTLALIIDVSKYLLQPASSQEPEPEPKNESLASSTHPIFDGQETECSQIQKGNDDVDDDGDDGDDGVFISDSVCALDEKSLLSSSEVQKSTEESPIDELTSSSTSTSTNRKENIAAEFGVESLCDSSLRGSVFDRESLETSSVPSLSLANSVEISDAQSEMYHRESDDSASIEPATISEVSASLRESVEIDENKQDSMASSMPTPLVTGNISLLQAALQDEMPPHQVDLYVQNLADMGFNDEVYVRRLLSTMQDYNSVLQKLLQESLDMWTVVETDDASEQRMDEEH